MPHHLYIAHKTLLALSGTRSLKVRFELSQGGSEPLSALWEYWDGKVWRPFRNSSNLCDPGTPDLIDTTAGYRQSGAVTLVTDCAETKELELNGIKNFWIRTRLIEPVLPNADRILPDVEQIELTTILEHTISTISGPEIAGGFLPDKAVVDGIDVDLSKPFYPFGQQPKPGAAFYFTADELFGKPGARVELHFIRTVTPQDVPMPGSSGGDRFEPVVDWEYWNGNRWETLTITAESATGARSLDPGVDTIVSPRAGEVTWVVPDDMEPVEVADHKAR